MENMGACLRGVYRDILLDANQRVLYDGGWVSNTIVEQGRSLLAAFMKGEAGATGIRFMWVGEGLPEWDVELGQADALATDLVKRTGRLDIDPGNINYLDDHDNLASPHVQPMHRLEIRAVLDPGFPENKTCDLREFGLFGTFNRDEFMINNVRHPLIQKAASDSLIRVVHLYF